MLMIFFKSRIRKLQKGDPLCLGCFPAVPIQILNNFKSDFSFQGQNYSSRLFCFVELSHKMAILHIVMGTFKTGCPFHTIEKTKQNHKSTAREITA